MKTTLVYLNLALRGLMELGVVCGLTYWGYSTGGPPLRRALVAVGAPLVGFGFWGAVDFRGAGSLAEALRLVQELGVSGLAALGFWVAGAHVLGGILALTSLIHHALTYLLGQRLLRATS